MDKNKVYIGIYKENNQESLFYQKDINIFYDLKKKKDVFSDEIQKDSLVSYNDIIKCRSRFKRKIIRLYDLDRIKKVSLDRVFIGNVYQITKIISKKYYGTNILNMGVNTEFAVKLIDKDALLYATLDNLEYTEFKNMGNGCFYEKPIILDYGNFYISREPNDLKLASIELSINSTKIEKGKLLEKYREYRQGRNK